jgi:uncharacterized protein YecE (DUF72 family)
MSTTKMQQYEPMPIPPDMTGKGFYVGLSGYYYDDWLGKFNPPKLSAKALAAAGEQAKLDQDRLLFYQKYFSFVEINNTFYNEPQLPHFLSITERSKNSMMYTVKVHKEISHTREWNVGKGCDAMKRHIYAVSPLIETGRFYSFLIQLEDHLYRNQDVLDYLLSVASEAVRQHVDVHIEFRHRSWHDATVLTALKNAGIGICNTEIPPVAHAFPLKAYASTDKGYIRYSGLNIDSWYPRKQAETPKEKLASRNARYDYLYSDEELDARVQGQIVLSKKATVVAVAYNNHYQAKAVRNAIANLQLLKKSYYKDG